MTRRYFVPRWLSVLGVTLALVGLVSQGVASAQTLAETRQSADQGDAEAQYNLALRYATGWDVRRNLAQAAVWWRKAADQGHVTAQYNLGWAYANGDGVRQSFTEAAAWWRKAADQGHVTAPVNLGAMYATGDGVPQNNILAHAWFNVAVSRATAGDTQDNIEGVRDELAQEMTPEQVVEAQQRAAEWQAVEPRDGKSAETSVPTGGVYRDGTDVINPRILREVKPQYTVEAMRAKVQGTVLLECVVLSDGTVGRVEIVKSLDPRFGLDLQAAAAAKQWRFHPGTLFGEPVAVLVTIALTFTLGD